MHELCYLAISKSVISSPILTNMIFCFLSLLFISWKLDVNQTMSYEITLVLLFVRTSVHLSLILLNIWSLVFSDIVHDDSWQRYVVTVKARFFFKELAAQIWPNGPKSDTKWGFLPFYWAWVIRFYWNCI